MPAAGILRRNLPLTPAQLEALWRHLRRVPDFRSRQGLRHPLPSGLATVLTSRLAGAKTPKESAEFAARLPPEHLQRLGARSLAGTYRAPSYHTIRRVLQGVDPLRFEAECAAWMVTQGAACEGPEALALGGKTLRRSYDHDLQEDDTTAATRLADYLLGIMPAATDTLSRLTVGGYFPRGRIWVLHSRLRYFDPERRRAGLPPDMAALAHELTDDSVSVTLVNLDQGEPREVAVQAGGTRSTSSPRSSSGAKPETSDASAVTVRLAPGAGQRLAFRLKRYANRPDLAFPWNRR